MQLPGKLIIAGDPDTRKFDQLLARYGLRQHVSSSTHISGGILDLVITRNNSCDSLDIKDIEIIDTPTTSDHSLVKFSCSFPHQHGPSKVCVTGRKIKDIDVNQLKQDLLQSDLNDESKFIDCNTAVEIYNRELTRILDIHAPEMKFLVNPDQSKWINTECQIARRKRRKAERDKYRFQNEDTKAAYKKAYKHVDAVINTTRNVYYKDRLKSSEGNKKETFKLLTS
jgi:hypothetical protein